MITGTGVPEESTRRVPGWRKADRRVRDLLGALFPAPPETASGLAGSRVAAVGVQVAAIALGAWLLLVRVPGVPPWDSLYLDDFGTFFARALEHPWQVYSPQHGYEQLVPHLVAQFALYVPLDHVPEVFALFGAVTTAACGLLVFHASAGLIRSVTLRALLGVAIVLLPIAPLEIADNTLGAPTYMLLALFWAILWRPRTWSGMAVAALLAFFTAASTTLVILFVPLLAARLYVLRRPRDHAVTAGWLAGCLVQVPVVISTYRAGKSPLDNPGQVRSALTFYAHDVVLPSLGWHLSWWLQSFAGRDGATVIVAVVLAIVFGLILLTQPANRLFVLTALLTGFVFSVFTDTLTPYATTSPPVTSSYELGSRYTALPIFLIESGIIAGVDLAIRWRGRQRTESIARRPTLAPVAAVVAVVMLAVVMVNWIPDFRYFNGARPAYATSLWDPIVNNWRRECEASPTGVIEAWVMPAIPRKMPIPCDRLRY
jgi:hypothetical protein